MFTGNMKAYKISNNLYFDIGQVFFEFLPVFELHAVKSWILKSRVCYFTFGYTPSYSLNCWQKK